MRWVAIGMLFVVAALVAVRQCREEPPSRWRCATFNIEHFPKDQRQVEGAFAEMATLGAGIIAVQEITDTELFTITARARLGASWEFVSEHAPDGTFDHEIGVLFDRDAYAFVRRRLHDGTRLGGRHKPTLDVELRDRASGETLRVLVIHFKSGGDSHPIRRRQFTALAATIAEVQRSGSSVIVLGDFNATGEPDRAELAKLAAATHTTWATEDLACSAFWERHDDCPRSRLDHVLTTERPIETRAAGGCETEGCETQESCPLYADHVSDHCPVVVTFRR